MLRNTLAPLVLALSAIALPAAAQEARVSPGARAFDIALYRELAKQPGNVFVSPYSVSSAFSLLYPGARGQSAQEIARTFGFDADRAAATAHARALSDGLRIRDNDEEMHLTIANAAWVERTMALKPDYASAIRDQLGATIEPLNFIGDPQGSLDRINAWAARQTNDRIPSILSNPDPLRRLVLTNAVYFNGHWLGQFNAGDTKDGVFHGLAGDVPARLMRKTETERRYFFTSTFQAVDLDYYDGSGAPLAMSIFLPTPRSNLARFEANLTPERLDGWLRQFDEQETNGQETYLNITLPKVRMNAEYELSPSLKAMGVRSIFTEGVADLSGIADQQLAVSAVVHKTFLNIDEEGTEAAAVTAVDIIVTSARLRAHPPIEFVADRPFFFVIRHKATGAILFMGRVATV